MEAVASNPFRTCIHPFTEPELRQSGHPIKPRVSIQYVHLGAIPTPNQEPYPAYPQIFQPPTFPSE